LCIINLALIEPIYLLKSYIYKKTAMTNETNIIRLQCRIGGTLKNKINEDIKKGYKHCEILKNALTKFYEEKEKTVNRY